MGLIAAAFVILALAVIIGLTTLNLGLRTLQKLEMPLVAKVVLLSLGLGVCGYLGIIALHAYLDSRSDYAGIFSVALMCFFWSITGAAPVCFVGGMLKLARSSRQ